MRHYLQLIRWTDHLHFIGIVFSAGVLLRIYDLWIVAWLMAMLFFAAAAFAVNELVDQDNAKGENWNPIHIPKDANLNSTVVYLIVFFCLALGLLISFS